MKVVIGVDHGGFAYKDTIINHLKSEGVEVIDVGTFSDKSCDYPDYAKEACKVVLKGDADFAVLVCGTGVGISIAANRFKGVRCAVCYNDNVARLAKEHNNANALAFGAREMTVEEIIKRIDIFMNATFEARHQIRLDKIEL